MEVNCFKLFDNKINIYCRFTKAKQVAVLHYEGAPDVEPEGDPTWEELHNEGLVRIHSILKLLTNEVCKISKRNVRNR